MFTFHQPEARVAWCPGASEAGDLRLYRVDAAPLALATPGRGFDPLELLLAQFPNLTTGQVRSEFGEAGAPVGASSLAVACHVLTTPDAVRPEGRGQVSAQQLRAECLKVVSPVISDTMRTAVARHMVKPSTLEADRAALLKLIEAPLANNLEAQVILYASDQTKLQTRSKLQGYLAAYAGEIMDSLLDTRA